MTSVLLPPDETARRLGLKNPNTLAVWRATNRYPLKYVRCGARIFYREEDVQAFIEARTFDGMTGQPVIARRQRRRRK